MIKCTDHNEGEALRRGCLNVIASNAFECVRVIICRVQFSGRCFAPEGQHSNIDPKIFLSRNRGGPFRSI